MQIREINIENVIKVFSEFNYKEENFNTSSINKKNMFWFNDYKKVTERLLEYFFDDIHKNDVIKYNSYLGSPMKINEKYRNTNLKNINRISFINMYPNIILKLYDKGKIKFNIEEYAEIYRFLVNNKLSFKNNLKYNNVINSIWNTIINLLYLTSNYNTHNVVHISDVFKVISYYRDCYDKISKFNNFICTNVDEIYYINDGSKNIENIINELNIPYKIDIIYNSYFINVNKFIIDNGEKILTNGIKIEYVKKSNSEYHRNIYDKYNMMNLNLRNRKIDKIISKCQ